MKDIRRIGVGKIDMFVVAFSFVEQLLRPEYLEISMFSGRQPLMHPGNDNFLEGGRRFEERKQFLRSVSCCKHDPYIAVLYNVFDSIQRSQVVDRYVCGAGLQYAEQKKKGFYGFIHEDANPVACGDPHLLQGRRNLAASMV